MTIEDISNRADPQLTNGIATAFAFDFLIQDASHLKVWKIDIATRDAVLLVKDTHYTVDFDTDEAGGTVTMLSVLDTGFEILILRRVPFAQETVIDNDGGTMPKVHENTFDYLAMEIQDLKDRLDHSFCIRVTEPGTDGGIVIEDFDGDTITGISGTDGVDGVDGAAGANGAGYAATSATSFAVGTGSKAFTTQAGLAYAVGARVHIMSAAAPTANYMDGYVTAYSGTTLTVLVDVVGGSGTHTDWSIALTAIVSPDLGGQQLYNILNNVVTVSANTLTISTALHDGRMLLFTHVDGCAVSHPDTLPIGFNYGWKQAVGAGQLEFIADGGGTLDSEPGHTHSKGEKAMGSVNVLENAGGSAAIITLTGNTDS